MKFTLFSKLAHDKYRSLSKISCNRGILIDLFVYLDLFNYYIGFALILDRDNDNILVSVILDYTSQNNQFHI